MATRLVVTRQQFQGDGSDETNFLVDDLVFRSAKSLHDFSMVVVTCRTIVILINNEVWR